MPNDDLNYDDLTALEDDATPVDSAFDPDADYAAPPPPLPDGWHLAKLKNLGAKDAEGNVKPFVGPRPWGIIPATFFTQIEAIVVDPGGAQDGKRTNRYNVTTHVEARQNNSSSAALVYRAITGKPIPGTTQGVHMGHVIELLKGEEPIVMIRTQLEGESPEASKAYGEAKKSMTPAQLAASGLKKPKTFRGEGKFVDDAKKITGVLVDPDTGETVVGRPQIVDIKPQSFTPPGGAK